MAAEPQSALMLWDLRESSTVARSHVAHGTDTGEVLFLVSAGAITSLVEIGNYDSTAVDNVVGLICMENYGLRRFVSDGWFEASSLLQQSWINTPFKVVLIFILSFRLQREHLWDIIDKLFTWCCCADTYTALVDLTNAMEYLRTRLGRCTTALRSQLTDRIDTAQQLVNWYLEPSPAEVLPHPDSEVHVVHGWTANLAHMHPELQVCVLLKIALYGSSLREDVIEKMGRIRGMIDDVAAHPEMFHVADLPDVFQRLEALRREVCEIQYPRDPLEESLLPWLANQLSNPLYHHYAILNLVADNPELRLNHLLNLTDRLITTRHRHGLYQPEDDAIVQTQVSNFRHEVAQFFT